MSNVIILNDGLRKLPLLGPYQLLKNYYFSACLFVSYGIVIEKRTERKLVVFIGT